MQKYLSEIPRLLKLSGPILIAQLAFTIMGFVDTVMSGAVSSTDMAAVAIANSLWFPILMLVIGVLMATTPIIAQLYGANKKDNIANIVQQALWLSFVILPPAMTLLYFSPSVLSLMNVEVTLARLTTGYLHVIFLALPFGCFYQIMRSYHEGLGITAPTMVIGLVGICINIPANYILINGLFGLPALGGVGCAVASLLVIIAMSLAMGMYSYYHPSFQSIRLFERLHAIDKTALKHIFSTGLPIAASLFSELALFSVATLLLAPLGGTVVAAHQVTLNFSSIVSILPLSLGMATTIVVGIYIGEKQLDKATHASIAALFIGVILSTVTALLIISFADKITKIYTDDMATLQMAARLVFISAFYQIVNSIPVIASGALRGYKATKVIFFVTFISYWGVGMTLGYLFALTDRLVPAMGAEGFWLGFIAGLSTSGILLIVTLHRLFQDGHPYNGFTTQMKRV